MEHNHHSLFGNIFSVLSIMFAWITLASVQHILTAFASVIAIASGVCAITYYYFAIKEKIINLKKHRYKK